MAGTRVDPPGLGITESPLGRAANSIPTTRRTVVLVNALPQPDTSNRARIGPERGADHAHGSSNVWLALRSDDVRHAQLSNPFRQVVSLAKGGGRRPVAGDREEAVLDRVRV